MTDLNVLQVGQSIRLSFTLPLLATDGERLTKPQEVEIFRQVIPAGAAAAGPSDTDWELWRTLAGEQIEQHRVRDSLVLMVPLSATEAPSTHVRFAVRSLTRGFRNRPRVSELSNVASLSLLEVPEALQGLNATTTEHAIKLDWNPPDQQVTAYRVFRSTTGTANSFEMIAEPGAPSYSDPNFEFGRSYFYKVSAIVKGGGSVAASADSQVVEVTPRDLFPPKPPQGLTALYTIDAVELIWNASPEPDLRGYNVYRRADGQSQAKLTSDPLNTPIFRDRDVVAGKTYTYRVTALDSAGNESSQSDAATAEVRPEEPSGASCMHTRSPRAGAML